MRKFKAVREKFNQSCNKVDIACDTIRRRIAQLSSENSIGVAQKSVGNTHNLNFDKKVHSSTWSAQKKSEMNAAFIEAFDEIKKQQGGTLTPEQHKQVDEIMRVLEGEGTNGPLPQDQCLEMELVDQDYPDELMLASAKKVYDQFIESWLEYKEAHNDQPIGQVIIEKYNIKMEDLGRSIKAYEDFIPSKPDLELLQIYDVSGKVAGYPVVTPDK